MTKGFKDRFIAERARALAIMYLTRRDDLVLQDAEKDSGLDYLVDIVRPDNLSKRSFGVLLRAAMAPVTAEQADAELRPSLKAFQRRGPFPYPVCLFFFTMREDRAYYTCSGTDSRHQARCRPSRHPGGLVPRVGAA
jgi:hypothetical protein